MATIDHVVTKRKVARMQRILEMVAVRHIQPDGVRVCRTDDLAVGSGNREGSYPRYVADQCHEVRVAVASVERHPCIRSSNDLKECPNRINHLALRIHTPLC